MNTEWQPIETAPKDGTEVLVFSSGKMFMSFYSHDVGSWCIDGRYDDFVEDVTHWMPLPQPPKEATHAPTR